MIREEAIEEIKRWTPILLNSGQCTEKTSEAQDMAISALSTEGEYIKKSELFDKTVRRNSIWNGTTNAEGKGLEEIVNDLPTYSFPDSTKTEEWITWLVERSVSYGILLSKIEKIRAEIEASMYCDKDTRLVENANASGLKKALEIIDKHIGGKDGNNV